MFHFLAYFILAVDFRIECDIFSVQRDVEFILNSRAIPKLDGQKVVISSVAYALSIEHRKRILRFSMVEDGTDTVLRWVLVLVPTI